MTFRTLRPNCPGPGGPRSQAPGWGRGRDSARSWVTPVAGRPGTPGLRQQRAAGRDVEPHRVGTGAARTGWARRLPEKGRVAAPCTALPPASEADAVCGHVTE